MKSIIIFIILISALHLNAQKAEKNMARQVANNWAANKMGLPNNIIGEQHELTHKADTTLFVFNLADNGFVIVSADKNTNPVLAYSNTGYLDMENIPIEFQSWLDYYTEMVLYNRNMKSNKKTIDKWDDIIEGSSLKSLQTNVPSLFESTSSSRWAAWDPYFNQAPETTSPQFSRGHWGCVPGRLSELMKYHKHPRIGIGSNTYTYDGITISESFNRIFEYEEMPYRLTYCGNGHPTCNDGSFNIIPGVTQKNIDQVGWLQYLAGVSVGMRWLGLRGDPETIPGHLKGTTGNTGNWAEKLATHFGYSANYDYWNNIAIQNDTEGFKIRARENLTNGIPILFRYETVINGGGHAVIIDGVEDDDFFHIIFGWGGHMDGYYYLFSSDSSNTHEPRPHIEKWGLNACFDIVPNCPDVQNQTYANKTVNINDGFIFEAIDNVTISNTTIIGNGLNGGKAVAKAANSVMITSNFEVQLGAQFSIYVEPCGN